MLESVGSAVLYPEGVTLPSPGSRSAPWDQVEPPASTPKGLHSTAQGLQRTLGKRSHNTSTLKGLYNPFRVEAGGSTWSQGALRDPGLGSVTPSG